MKTYLSSSLFICAQIICSGTFYLQKSFKHTREQNRTFLLKQDYWVTSIILLGWIAHTCHFLKSILFFRMKPCVVWKNGMNPCTYQVITNYIIPASVFLALLCFSHLWNWIFLKPLCTALFYLLWSTLNYVLHGISHNI